MLENLLSPVVSEAKLVKQALKRRRYFFQAKLLKTEGVKRFDDALDTGSPIVLRNFFRNAAEHIGEYVDFKKMMAVRSAISEINQFERLLTPDDEKIIEFLVSCKGDKLEVYAGTAASVYFIAEVIQDLESKKGEMPVNVLVVCLMWLYVTLYELIVATAHNRVYSTFPKLFDSFSITKKEKEGVIYNFEKAEENNSHVTAGELNKILSLACKIPYKNASIFGEGRELRNDFSHAGTIYESEEKVIVLPSGERVSHDEFITGFYKLYAFLVKWLDASFADKGKTFEDLESMFKLSFEEMSRFCLKIERSHKRPYLEYIIRLKSEVD